MANRKHLAILRRGITTWNLWRLAHPEIMPDLHRAQLQGADLREADFRWADLWEVNLQGSQLERADFRNAFLCYADLQGADLRDADLEDAKLTGAKIRRAEFDHPTDLGSADILRVDLSQGELGGRLRKAEVEAKLNR